MCSFLGCAGVVVTKGASFGEGSGPIYFTKFECTGTEGKLLDCSYSAVTTKCNHSKDAGVKCKK